MMFDLKHKIFMLFYWHCYISMNVFMQQFFLSSPIIHFFTHAVIFAYEVYWKNLYHVKTVCAQLGFHACVKAIIICLIYCFFWILEIQLNVFARIRLKIVIWMHSPHQKIVRYIKSDLISEKRKIANSILHSKSKILAKDALQIIGEFSLEKQCITYQISKALEAKIELMYTIILQCCFLIPELLIENYCHSWVKNNFLEFTTFVAFFLNLTFLAFTSILLR